MRGFLLAGDTCHVGTVDSVKKRDRIGSEGWKVSIEGCIQMEDARQENRLWWGLEA